MISLFMETGILLASIGLVLATSSFISGLQLVRGKHLIELKIHRFSGYTSTALYVVLAVLWLGRHGLDAWPIVAWAAGLLTIMLKVYIVKTRPKAFKYVSWIGGTLVGVWVYIVYIHIPV